MAYLTPAVSFSFGHNHATDVEINDVVVRALNSQEDKQQWLTLFNEDFERLNEKNSMKICGQVFYLPCADIDQS
jgi:hypothetical protein